MEDVPAYEQFAASIRLRIASGELLEGARLPSEIALASASGFSRSTVREALRTLEEAGYVERASARVRVISNQSRDGVSREMTRELKRRATTFRQLLEALLAMDPELSRLAAQRCDAAEVRELERILVHQAAKLDDFDAWNRLDEEFHLGIAAFALSPALATARGAITDLLVHATTRFVRWSSMTSAGLEFHHRILREIEAGEAESASLMTRAHINDFGRTWSRHGHSLDEEIGAPDPFDGGNDTRRT